MTTKNTESSNGLDSIQNRKDIFTFFAIRVIILSGISAFMINLQKKD